MIYYLLKQPIYDMIINTLKLEYREKRLMEENGHEIDNCKRIVQKQRTLH